MNGIQQVGDLVRISDDMYITSSFGDIERKAALKADALDDNICRKDDVVTCFIQDSQACLVSTYCFCRCIYRNMIILKWYIKQFIVLGDIILCLHKVMGS